jgi:hypothetical protein
MEEINQMWAKVGEKEVHGDVEVCVTGDSQDDEQVPNHKDQVHEEKQFQEDGLQFRILWENHEMKLWD